MAKLIEYVCDHCGESVEEIFKDTEDQPEVLVKECPKCGGPLARGNNWKSNCQTWRFNDTRFIP